MHRIFKAARQCGYLKDVIEPIDPREAKNISREKIVYLCTGSQGEPMAALMRIANIPIQMYLLKKMILSYFHLKLFLVMKKNYTIYKIN